MEYYLAIKKNEVLPSMTARVNSEDVIRSEMSQTQEDKHYMASPVTGKLKTSEGEDGEE